MAYPRVRRNCRDAVEWRFESDAGPLVSVVVPAYNQAGYLGEAIESLLSQDYPNVEIIAIDDGSTDDTGAVLARYAGRISTMRHTNRGQAATLNRGWRAAKGEILGYLSADDTLEPNAITKAVQCLLANTQSVLAYCDFHLIDPASRRIRKVKAPDFDFRSMVVNLICAPGPGAFFRRAAYEKTTGWDESYRQIPDFEFWLRLGRLGTFIRVPEVLASYRVHESSPSFSAVSAERADESIRAIVGFFSTESTPASLIPFRNEAVANAMMVSARLHIRSGRWQAALQRMASGIRLYPQVLLRRRTSALLLNAITNKIGHRLYWKLNRVLRGSGAQSK